MIRSEKPLVRLERLDDAALIGAVAEAAFSASAHGMVKPDHLV